MHDDVNNLERLRRIFWAVVALALVALAGATILESRSGGGLAPTVEDGPMSWLGFVALVLVVMGLIVFSALLFSRLLRDMSIRIQTERELAERTAISRAVLEGANEGIVTATAVGEVVSCNPAAAKLFGTTPDGVVGRRLHEFVPVLEGATLDELTTNGTRQSREVSGWRGSETFPLDISVSVVPRDDEPIFSLILRDLTERRSFEEQLIHQALHDPVTGLPNRASFLDRLSLALSRASLNQASVAVLVVALDRFRVVNESLGHGAGDDLLRSVARRLSDSVRPGDTVARIGGDEFAVLYDLGPVGDPELPGQRLEAALIEPFDIHGQPVFLTASIGVAVGTGEDVVPADVLRDASAAMVKAKGRGRARIEMFGEEMRGTVIPRLELENALRSAVERGELFLTYQPKIELASGRVVGAEALVRWQHPERGLIMPNDFISLAEEAGLIVPIGDWVFEQACHDSRRWHEEHEHLAEFVVSVNVSPRQLGDSSLVERFRHILEETGVDPQWLQLEVTETALMEDPQLAAAKLARLRALGLRLAIDDFGTGYSSLAYLKRFPIDLLKIDRSFVDGVGDDPDDTAIAAAVIRLAHVLGLQAIAEGVENERQLDKLNELGCDQAQGFLWSAPISADALIAFIAERVAPSTS